MAVLSIILLHLRGRVGENAGWVAYWNQLSWGVGIFFVISGFLLYRPFVAASAGQTPRIPFRAFYKRRILRIVPGYWLALTALGLAFGLGIFGHDTWRYYLLAQSYSERTLTGGLQVTWSLSIEASLYAILPLFVIAVGLCRRWINWRPWLVDLAMVTVAVIVLSGLLLSWDHVSTVEQLAISNTIIFLFGMCLAALSVGARASARVDSALARFASHDVVCWIAALVLILCGTAGLLPSQMGNVGFLMEAVAATLIVLPAIGPRTTTSRVQRLLSNRYLAWVGLISYGLYLWHSIIVFELRGSGTREPLALAAVNTVVAVALTFVVAALSFYLVEQPIMKLGRRRPEAGMQRQPGKRPSLSSAVRRSSGHIRSGLRRVERWLVQRSVSNK